MRAVLFLLSTWPRRRRATLAAVAVLAAAAVGFVLLAGLGARRASTGWDRLRHQTGGEDLLLDIASIDSALEVAERTSALPGVAGAWPVAYGYLVPEGSSAEFSGGVIIPLEPGALDTVWRHSITSGRQANPAQVNEVVVNELFRSTTGLGVGSGFTLVDPVGLISQPVRIVGISVLPSDFTFATGSAIAYPTSAFVTRWMDQIRELSNMGGNALVGPTVLVTGTGSEGEDLTAAIVEALPDAGIAGINATSTTSSLVVETLDLQRDGYLALSLVGGLAALSVIALMLVRATHVTPAEASALAAVGFTRRDIQLAVLVPGGALALVAAAGSVVVAALGEALVPTGVARDVAAGRGLDDDLEFLALAGATSAVALFAVVLAVAWRSGRAGDARVAPGRRRSAVLAWPSVGVGLRAAGGGLASSGRRQARAALAAVAIAGVGISAVGVVVRSRDALREDLSRVGKFYDVLAGFYPGPDDLVIDREALVASPSVTGVTTIEVLTVEVDGTATAAIAVSAQKGDIDLRIAEGRPAVGDDELLASAAFLHRLHRSVGDTVEVAGDGGTHPFRVVGSTVLPLLSPSGVPGEQVALTTGGRARVGVQPGSYAVGVQLRDRGPLRALGRGQDAIEACDTDRLLPLLGIDALTPLNGVETGLCAPVSDIRVANIEELGALPGGVIGSFAVVAAAGVAYVLSSSFRRARRDVAVLRVLGFSRRQSMTTVLVQAGTVGLAGAILALPFGVALGRAAWRGVADGAGVAAVPEVPLTGSIGLILGAVAGALLLSLPFAARSVARPPSTWLRAE